MPLDKHEKNALDTVQFNMHEALQDIERLKLRVSALEAGAPLPADKVPEIQPTLSPPTKVSCTTEHFTAPVVEPQSIETPDISVGWVGGALRK